jgi:3-dehydroquinate dehydratase / shikimate dehydrogenase
VQPEGLEPICVVIGRTRHKMLQIEIQEAAKRGAQMIELRLDFLAKAPDFKRMLAAKPCEMVATVRRPVDGGRWPGTEDERLLLLRQAIVGGFDWIDLETDVAEKIRRYKDVKRIVSYHNLREVPHDLETIHARMCDQDADVVKIAVTAHSILDNLRVLKLIRGAKKPTVAFCMGDVGWPSRLLGARQGAPFTYAAFNRERGIAPGILSYEDLKKIYRYPQINPATRVFGVVGDPVGHSLSPLLHNTAFRAEGIDAVYVPFRVQRGQFEEFVQAFRAIPVDGYSVTIPHKEAAAEIATERDDAVELTKAANTLIIKSGGLAAYNTDYRAACDSLLANLPPSPDGSPPSLSGRVVLIVGAGGVAHAIAHALHREGAVLSITNRSMERAQRLAEEVGCRAVEWAARHSVVCEMLINCTSVGMMPDIDESPIHPSFLKPGFIVMDCVYTPENTILIKEARNRKCHIITGLDLFVRQAAVQFELFTGRKAPFNLMYQTAKRALSPVVIRDDE